MLYHIDVPTYHWDNDHFETEVRILRTSSIDEARKMQRFLRGLTFEDDDLLTGHSWGASTYRDKKTFVIPYWLDRDEIYDRIDLYNGVIVESSFDIYTEKTTRTIVE